MKRFAILIGGLLVLPVFAEVAPVFIEDESAFEYADGMYDENGFLVVPGAEIVDTETETDASKTQTPVKISRAPVNATPVANRTTATRAMPASAAATTSGRGSANGNSSRVVAARTTTTSPRGTASRTVASRGTTATSPRTGMTSTRTATSTAATRAAAARTTGGATRATTATKGATVARTATSAGRTTAARTATATTARAATSSRPSVDPNRNVGTAPKNATITASNGTVTLNDSGGTLYNKSASNRRTPTIRMSSLNGISAETTAVSTMSLEDMDDLAELTDYCKAQYANCMDNYCNVLDDNQGRCSCSANIKNYAKTEAALKTATEELQDVAQKIQYIGLTSREVETLFTETIAEETMRTKGTDNSQLQASLNKIKDMIIDVKSGTATSSSSNDILGLNFDLSGLLEFSFDSTGFDLGSLFGTTNTNSVSNQRGEELYKTAAARCKSSVLKACTARGVDASIITNAYDLEIDRECMAYERSLNDSNDQMLATVRNAKNVLQKARLMVAQQKNAYDMRGCINALDSCMQDEFVCGSDYENCLDPTGRYIVNGAIVVGSQPGHAIDPELSNNVASVMTSDVCRVNLYRTWDMVPGTCNKHVATENGQTAPNYTSYPSADQGNAWGSGTGDTLSKYIEKTVTGNYPNKTSENMSLYLQNKIGYNDKDRNYGMCMSVLNKCQDYTYTRGTGTSAQYEPANQVVQQYLARVLVQIKAKQDEILANYAETCVSDVTSCLGQNGYPTEDPNDWERSEYSTNRTKMNIAVNACRAQIVTCMSVNGYSIDTPTPTEMNCWVQGLLYSTSTDDCMWDNLKQDCEEGKWVCSSTGECVDSEEQCPQEYTVYIDCNGGTPTNILSKTTTNKDLYLNKTWCTRSGYTLNVWKCGQNNLKFLPNTSYRPSVNNTTCTATWSENTPTPPAQEYTVIVNCGKQPNTFITGVGEIINTMATCAEGACGQVSTEDGCIYLDTTSNGGRYCNWDSDTTPVWQCNGLTPAKNGMFCPNSDGIICVVSGKGDSSGTSDPEWVTITLNSGTGATPANPSTLYVDGSHSACHDVYGTTTLVADETCPQYLYELYDTPSKSGMQFNGFKYYNIEYINKYGYLDSTLFTGLENDITLTADWTPISGRGSITINANGGTRTGSNNYITKLYFNSECSDGFRNIDECNGSAIITNIGAISFSDSFSDGFWIEFGNQKVHLADESGNILSGAFNEVLALDSDELTATARNFPGANYITFQPSRGAYTSGQYSNFSAGAYDVYGDFNIEFYPNSSGYGIGVPSKIQHEYGKNAYLSRESNDGYTLRGYYPKETEWVTTTVNSNNCGTNGEYGCKSWPVFSKNGSGNITISGNWVLLVPKSGNDNANFNKTTNTLRLYAGWAKNCENPDGGTCNLDVDNDGSVTYTISCNTTGYTPSCQCATATCSTSPGGGDDSEWLGFSY